MQQLKRLLRYLVPYLWFFIPSVLLFACVGFLDAFRLVLLGPVLDRVLNPTADSGSILLFKIPHTGRTVYLQAGWDRATSNRDSLSLRRRKRRAT